MKKKTNLINHVALVVDDSGSMAHLKNKVIDVVNKLVDSIGDQSRREGQETRLSIYTFGEKVNPEAFDRDINRVPNASDYYKANQGHTCLIDAAYEAIEDLSNIQT